MYGIVICQGEKEIFKSSPAWATEQSAGDFVCTALTCKGGNMIRAAGQFGDDVDPWCIIPCSLFNGSVIRIYESK